jgi:hypothetical protein
VFPFVLRKLNGFSLTIRPDGLARQPKAGVLRLDG